jgi:TolB-like protein/DNA-binding SARP family transcriptional activator/Tfp pilus assembly protein PilF
MFSLKLFGGACLKGEDGLITGPAAQRHRVALLALLAAAHPDGMSRDKLIAHLWSERDTEHGRNLLKQAVHALRRALGEEAILAAGDELRLNPEVIPSDVTEFGDAFARGDHARAAVLYRGPFLDGFFLRDAPEFERWVDRERDRLAGSYARVLEALAEAAERRVDFRSAAASWKARAAHDPYDSRVALRLMRALEASGNRAGALQHAAIHERLLQEELGMRPGSEVGALVEQLRRAPAIASVIADKGHESALWPRAPVDSPAPGDELTPSERSASESTSRVPRRTSRLAWRAIARASVAVLGVATLLSVGWLLPRIQPRRGAAVEARPPGRKAVAVLPFANLSRDPRDDYFSDGLTEELIGALSRVRALRVAARTSAFAFKGANRDIREIGRALNVGTVLEGSVRKEGDRVRVTAQLIDVADGFRLWSATYEREMSNVFALQNDIALRIASALEAELTPADRERLTRQTTVNPEAYALYLKGRYFWNQRTGEGFTRAIEYFGRAIEADPSYAKAYAGLASVYGPGSVLGYIPPRESRARMREAALKALELDDGLAEAHSALGAYLHVHAWDSDAAEREHRRAIELDPSHPTARFYYGNLLAATGRLDEALAQKRKAVELDPLAPMSSVSLAATLLQAGQPDAALEHLRNAIELDSTYWRAHEGLGFVYEATGSLDDAVRSYERAVELAGSTPLAKAAFARGLARAGRVREARRTLTELQAAAARTGVHAPSVATVLLALNDTEGALAWLEQAYRERHPQLRFIASGPGFKPLEGDPRFVDLLRRVGLRRLK